MTNAKPTGQRGNFVKIQAALLKFAAPCHACGVLVLALFFGFAAALSSAGAQEGAPKPPAEVQDLLRLLSQPSVQTWLAQQKPGASPQAPAAAAEDDAETESDPVARRLSMVRAGIAALVTTVPRMPAEFARARDILQIEFEEYGVLQILLLVATFIGTGFLADRLYFWLGRGARERIISNRLETVQDRLRAVGMRLAFGTGAVLSFVLGSIGAFLLFEWPPLLRLIVVGYLQVFIAFRFAYVICLFLLAPRVPRFRIVPMRDEAARFFERRIIIGITYIAFGRVTIGLLSTLGFSEPSVRLLASLYMLGLLAILVEAVWRRPALQEEAIEKAEPGPGIATQAQDGSERAARRVDPRARRMITNVAVTAALVVAWAFRLAGAGEVSMTIAIALALSILLGLARQSVRHVLRPGGSEDSGAMVPTVTTVCLERGLRAAIIIGAAFVLADAWGLDFGRLAESESTLVKLMRGAINAAIILLLADFGWHLFAALIDRRLMAAQMEPGLDVEESRRRARLRTLLPILRNLVHIVLFAMAALMALSALGIEIGPLIAGAGVVGVAVGFGAQTLVKDILSGVFYLMDDAFRVGEYIQAGQYKGVVESFSLRSVKLRHHRGPVYTVPFGVLGAIQNMSRDWVIDKVTIRLTYDTDLEKARKLVKDVGKTLAADPEMGPNILEPMKMQGVEQFGEFGMDIRMKMKTKPGEQFVIRRKAYAAIKKAFDANGIKFAFPTVQVAGGGDGDAEAAAARRVAQAQAEAKAAPA